MFSSSNKLPILLLLLGILIIFIIYNLQPVTLVFLGIQFPLKLPVALWMLLFLISGAFTSLCLQVLNFSPRKTAPKVIYRDKPQAYSPKPPQRETSPEREPTPIEFPSNDSTATSTPSPDLTSATPPKEESQEQQDYKRSPADSAAQFIWEPGEKVTDEKRDRKEEEDWNIEEAPRESTRISSFDRSLNKEDKSNVFETQQQPKTVSRSGSIYSYTYKEPKDTGVGKSEKVYDAEYRVIRPPHRDLPHEPIEDDEDDEDWIG